MEPTGAKGIKGTIEIEPEYIAGLKDVDGFSHIFLLYHFHLSEGYSLEVKPFMDDVLHGVFATRAPRRPNSIGISVVRLVRIESHILHIRKVERTGWLSQKADKVDKAKADERFKL
jgi:tRNA (Thr-GGU) A37 N-methylase